MMTKKTKIINNILKLKKMKTMYRITLFPQFSNGLAETLAVLAAKSNGSEKGYTLEDLKNVAEGQKILYPTTNENTTCELVGGTRLHLDRKVGEQYETALILEQVDILEIPTLQRYDSELEGIANPSFHENLN
jgi:hypothetical protein